MSRITRLSILIPLDIDIKLNNKIIFIKGIKGNLNYKIHDFIIVKNINNILKINILKKYKKFIALLGTTKAIINNMIIGVSQGFKKKLQIIGIGYKAIINSNIINLNLGFSHLIQYKLPKNIYATCKNLTLITIKGINKQVVGQVAADIRNYSPPEIYKGKGIRYLNEIIKIKETKKK